MRWMQTLFLSVILMIESSGYEIATENSDVRNSNKTTRVVDLASSDFTFTYFDGGHPHVDRRESDDELPQDDQQENRKKGNSQTELKPPVQLFNKSQLASPSRGNQSQPVQDHHGANVHGLDQHHDGVHHGDDGKLSLTDGERRRRQAGDESDNLSRNTTMILDSLLKNYDETERPAYRQGEPTRVKVNILIRSMGPISETDMFYSMDCYFRQYWRDTRLSFRGLKSSTNQMEINQLSLNVKMLEKIWKPDTYFHNGLNSYLHTITRPNKLLRISEDGDITYSMRLTIKAKCPMLLINFPMDHQSCPLVFGSFAYTADEVEYKWIQSGSPVGYEGELQLSQFDITRTEYRNLNFTRSESIGTYSVLQVIFLLQRHTGYFLIQVYVPCTLIVVLSWVGFWLNREATSDRVTLGVTAVLTLSAIALDSRTDLPKVHYATALDWFIICSFGYCMATLLEFAGVHYFTKVGYGESYSIDEDDKDESLDDQIEVGLDEDWEDVDEEEDYDQDYLKLRQRRQLYQQQFQRQTSKSGRWDEGCIATVTPLASQCSISAYNNLYGLNGSASESNDSLQYKDEYRHLHNHVQIGNNIKEGGGTNGKQPFADSYSKSLSLGDRDSMNSVKSSVRVAQTQTEKTISLLRQFTFCLLANVDYRKAREKEAVARGNTWNSVSKIDSFARIMFPLSFLLFNAIYWTHYFKTSVDFQWGDHAVSGNIQK